MMTVPLHGNKAAGRVALVDDDDYDLVMQYRWIVFEGPQASGRGHRGPYVQTTVHDGGKCITIRMHNLIMGRTWIDHIDHDGLNNQRSNLRPVTPDQNQYNARPRAGTSRFKGVFWYKADGRWEAAFRLRGKRHYLGRFATEEEAARAYDAGVRVAYGEYAYLNFPDEAGTPH
jgi:AP2 domain